MKEDTNFNRTETEQNNSGAIRRGRRIRQPQIINKINITIDDNTGKRSRQGGLTARRNHCRHSNRALFEDLSEDEKRQHLQAKETRLKARLAIVQDLLAKTN